MHNLLFVQMSGTPGAGKTTLANALAPHIGAVIIDHDVTKSALLTTEVQPAIAGRASYAVLFAIARHLLEQGHSVIFDSPCVYATLLTQGQQLAAEYQAAYRYIECLLNDLSELDKRLRHRTRLSSQLSGVYQVPPAGSSATQAGEATFFNWIANAQRPTAGYLILDTARPMSEYLDEALAYVRSGIGNR